MSILSRINFFIDEHNILKLCKKTIVTNNICDKDTSEQEKMLAGLVNEFSHDFYVIREDNIAKGFIMSYNFRLIDGNFKMAIAMDNNCQINKKEAIIEFLNNIFMDYPMNKVFCEVFEEDLTELVSIGFSVELQLNEHIFISNSYKDMYILGMNRDEFYKNFNKL